MKMKYFYICLFLVYNVSAADDFMPKIDVDRTQHAHAAMEVIKRIIPEKAKYFKIYIRPMDGNDRFSLLKRYEHIEIKATSGVAATWGFHHYLKYYCNSHIGWQVRNINIPDDLPDVKVTIVAKDRFRYYQNVCTTSYSFVWWNMTEWQNHLDWIALNGINLALAPHGQEAIWRKVYKTYNLTEDEIDEHFAGPAFLSWQRMGNIRGWGGPLSWQWHQHSLDLQKFVVNSMKNLGIIPALPAFAGFVPDAFNRIFPNASMNRVVRWNHFEPKYCCPLFLEPTDPLFLEIGSKFLKEMTASFGFVHFYYSDPFNEIPPVSDDIEFIGNVSASIYKSMTAVDKNAIWLLQNWMFVNEQGYWTQERAEKFLTAVPLGRILVLDLQSEQRPQYERHPMYYGQPFIWCMLHNFGGTLGMFGSSHAINNEIYNARNAINSTMIGVGLTPEGINQNYVIYDLVLESSWRSGPVDLSDWVKDYSTRRYGSFDDNAISSWKLLMKTVYDFRGQYTVRGKYISTHRPNLNLMPQAWYTENDIVKSLEMLLMAKNNLKDSDGYKHDLVDVTRQLLQYRCDQIYITIMEAYNEKDLKKLKEYVNLFYDALSDMEIVLSSHKDFLLGNWLESAKRLANNTKDRKLFEYNARNQVTLWGPNGEIFDYANKQWSGLISDYYGPRWVIFMSGLVNATTDSVKLNMTLIRDLMFKNVEEPFTFSTKVYPTTGEGNCIAISQKMFDKWSSLSSYTSLKIIPNRGLSNKFRKRRKQYIQLHYYDLYNEIPHIILIH